MAKIFLFHLPAKEQSDVIYSTKWISYHLNSQKISTFYDIIFRCQTQMICKTTKKILHFFSHDLMVEIPILLKIKQKEYLSKSKHSVNNVENKEHFIYERGFLQK